MRQCEVIRFYGFAPDALDKISVRKYATLAKSMDVLKAREQLRMMEAVGYPHMKEKPRQDLHRSLSMKSVTEDTRAKRAIKAEDLNAPTLSPEKLKEYREKNGRKNRNRTRLRDG